MGSQRILPKRVDTLDAYGNDNTFKVNVDVLNECFGANISMYMKASYPSKATIEVENSDVNAFVWLPKMFANSSGWVNKISANEEYITENYSVNRTQNWHSSLPQYIGKYRITFIKESKNGPYRFVGVYKECHIEEGEETSKNNLAVCNKYKRISTKIKLLGNPVNKIEML